MPDTVSGPIPAPTGAPPGDRDRRTGRFLRGNRAAVRTGLRAGLGNIGAALDDEVQNFLEDSLADDGGREQIPRRRFSQHQYRAALHRQIVHLNAALETHGLFDRRGKLRVAWLSKLEGLMREARAFDQSLGLTRREKPVPNLDAYLTERYSGSKNDGPPSSAGPGEEEQQ